MIRLAIALSLFALPAAAQERFDASFTVKGAIEDSRSISGTAFGYAPVGPGPEWMKAEIYAYGVNQGVTCATADEFELDFFFGEEGDYAQNLLVTLARAGDGWTGLEPALFHDVEIPGQEANWETYDNAVATVDAFECLADDLVQVTVSYKGVLSDFYGQSTVGVDGTGQAVMRLQDMSGY